jgi:hypothetical protein
MRHILFGTVTIFALAIGAPETPALTPAQSTAAAMKAKADAQAKLRAEALAKAKAEAAARARAESAARSKVKISTALSVRAETMRRIEAATKAAEANARVTSFRAISTTPRTLSHGPGGHDVVVHRHDTGPSRQHALSAEHSASRVGHAR